MFILGIDPGISNLGWSLVDVRRNRHCAVIDAGTFTPDSHRKMTVRKIPARTTKTGKTFRARRIREAVPGSLSDAENTTQRCGQIFQFVSVIIGERLAATPVRAVVIEDRTVNALWAAHLKMAQQGVLTAIWCAAVQHNLPIDLIPVKDVHAAFGVKIPRGADAKPIMDAAVRTAAVNCAVIDRFIVDKRGKPSSKRVHAIDATGVVVAASKLEFTRTYRLLEDFG